MKKLFLYLNRRRENDLILDLEIDMVEALCGFRKVIKTLDKRSLVITTIPGKLKLYNLK